jgi:hypothetical protein
MRSGCPGVAAGCCEVVDCGNAVVLTGKKTAQAKQTSRPTRLNGFIADNSIILEKIQATRQSIRV